MSHRGGDLTENENLMPTSGAALERTLSAEFTEKALDQNFADHQMEIALSSGQMSLHQVNRMINDSRVTSDIRDEQTKKSKESTNTMMFIAMLNELEEQANWHAEQAQGYEDGFVEVYGEDWREDMAQDLLDPEVLVRGDDETQEEYRARLERELIDELLNDDGSIKDEYKDHPEYHEWALWAQHRHAQRTLENTIDEANNAAPEDRPTVVQTALQQASVQQHWQAAAAVDHSAGDSIEATIESSHDAQFDEIISAQGPTASTENGFG